MEFAEVVMKRRAVRRFEEGGVDREVIERIARLAQRTPSAGFSQGQRLVVVTDPAARREVARICGEEEYEADFGPWISECAAQFIPCVSEAIYHRRYQEPDKVVEDGDEIEWPVPFWWVDIGATMQNIMLAAVNEGLGCGFVGPGHRAAAGVPRHPDEFVPIGVMPVGRPLPDVRSPSLKRGWVPFESSRAGSAGAERSSARRRPRARWRIDEALAPGLRAAEVAVRRRRAGRDRGERRGIRPPRREQVRQPGLDLAERRPAVERPASLEADPLERALGEHDVAVAAAYRSLSPSPMNTTRRPAARWASTRSRLHVPHTKHAGWPFGNAIDGRRPCERGPGGHDGQLRHAERSERRLDEEAEAIGHDLDRDAGRLGPPDERHEARDRAAGAAAVSSRAAGSASTSDISQAISRREPMPPASYSADGLLPHTRHVLDHDHVGHVGQRDRAVVVDQDGQRRLPRPSGGGRRRRIGRRPARPIASVIVEPPGPRDASRVNATPTMMMPPPTTWTGSDRLVQEDGREHDRHRRDQRLERDDPRRAEQPDAVEDDDVGEGRGEQPGIRDRQDESGAAAGCSGPMAPGASNWPIPIGARTSVPPIVAQVVSTSGEWWRRTGAERGVRRPAERGGQASGRPDRRAGQHDPDAGRDDEHDADERQGRATAT